MCSKFANVMALSGYTLLLLFTGLDFGMGCTRTRLVPCHDVFTNETDEYHATTQNNTMMEKFTKICRIVLKYANCTYNLLADCEAKILNEVDQYFAQYLHCQVPSSQQRGMRVTLSASVLTTTKGDQQTFTNISAQTELDTTLPSGTGTDQSCGVSLLKTCDDQWKNDTTLMDEVTVKHNYTSRERLQIFCIIMWDYANCTYPKLNNCYKKTVDFVDNYFARYPFCNVTTAAERGIRAIPDPTVPPDRKDANCNTTGINVCVTTNSKVISKMAISLGNHSEKTQKKMICREGEIFADCLYYHSMGCTNDYLDKVDNIIRRYNTPQFNCSIAYYPERDTKGKVSNISTQSKRETTLKSNLLTKPRTTPSKQSTISSKPPDLKRTTSTSSVTPTFALTVPIGVSLTPKTTDPTSYSINVSPPFVLLYSLTVLLCSFLVS